MQIATDDILAGLLRRLERIETESTLLRQKLEHRTRRANPVGFFAVAVVGVGMILGGAASQPDSRPASDRAATPPPTLVAEQVIATKFVLADRDGTPRGAYSLLPDGAATLLLCDARRKAGIGLTVANDGSSSIILSDKNDKTRARLELSPDGAPALTLFDEREHARVEMLLLPDASPEINLFDAAVEKRARLAVESDGWSRMQLLDNADRPRVTILARPADAAGVFLIDRAAVPRVTLLAKENGEPRISLSDAEHKTFWQAP